jgi:hypothetical protein
MNVTIRDGFFYHDSADLVTYAIHVVAAAIFFVVLYWAWTGFFVFTNGGCVGEWRERNSERRIRFVGMWTSNVHHFFIPSYMIYVMSKACTKGDEFAIGAEGTFLWFSDAQCLIQPNKDIMYGLCFSLGYFLYDFVYLWLVVVKQDGWDKSW